MDRLDRGIERLQAENNRLLALAYTLPIECKDLYKTPLDLEFLDSLGGLDSGSRGSSPLSILLGYSASKPTKLDINYFVFIFNFKKINQATKRTTLERLDIAIQFLIKYIQIQ